MSWGTEPILNHFTGETKYPTVIDIETGNNLYQNTQKLKDTGISNTISSVSKIILVDGLPKPFLKNELIHLLSDHNVINYNMIQKIKEDKYKIIEDSFMYHLPISTLYKIKDYYGNKAV